MKIQSAHYDFIKAKCDDVLRDNPDGWEDYKAAGLSQTRFRWDVAHKAGLTPFFCRVIYPYASDSHIDTALRKAMPL